MTMTIYVDYFPDWYPVPAMWTGGGHMLGTDLDELHEFAQAIGLQRRWFQSESTFAHYDLTSSKRRVALVHGATAVEPGQTPGDCLVLCKNGKYEQYSDRIWRAEKRRREST